MNFLSWMLSLGILVFVMVESVSFHQATVCRQKAWLKGTELRTHALLTPPKNEEKDWHAGCRMIFFRKGEEITWQKLPSLNKRTFTLLLDGRL